MEKYTFMKAFCAFGVAVACVGVAAGCSGTENNGGNGGSSGAVAATVNGTEIYEDQITNTIQTNREQMGLAEEDAWGEWLAQNKATPESIRSEIIEGYVTQEVVRQSAAAQGISVEADTVQSYVDQMRSNYNDDEAWQNALASAGVTEDEYRQNIELSLIMQQLRESLTTDAEPTEDQILEYAKMYATYYDGAKKSSHILFDASDEATAQEVLAKINDGSLDFAEAAKQYSTDSSASDGGNVGWDKLTQFVTEYQTALDGLEEGQVSDLVTSQFGIHIIKCTEVYQVPEGGITSLDQLPTEIAEAMRLQVENSSSDTFTAWFSNFLNSAQLDVHDMPSGLPYDVDMSAYTASNDEATQQPENGVEGTEAPVEGDQPAEGEQPADQPTEGGNAADQQPTEGAEGGEGTEGAQPADQAANEGGEGGEATPAQ